ncbi:MAG: aldo/keto reductase [Bacteroidota bacterium]|nr:aldo/keto reductase [Bacteroidota bacterium]
MEYVTLNNGVQMPIAGFGTLNLQQDSCAEKVAMAIRKGYRLIDAARNYANEVEVGKGIRMSGIDRKELFITSKLWIKDAGYETTLKAFQKTLDRLGLDYLDLYLIHQPFGDIYGTWRAMEELYRQGKIRAIGVSNFEGDRLIDLIYHNEIKPAVNQIEINPYNQQMVDVAVCKEFGVQAEAWGPLGQMRRPELLEEPVLVNIGKKYGKTPAQIIFRWLTQRGIVVLCKTEHEAYMDENLSIFDFHLSEQDIVEIGKLETGRSIFRTHREPEDVKWFLEKATRPLLDEE